MTRLGSRRWRAILLLLPACFRAATELAIARIRHQFIRPGDIQAMNKRAGSGAHVVEDQDALGAEGRALVDQVAFVLPRVAPRLPWRADCLIQAMAAQRWLRARGIASSISIGVRRSEEGEFESHAWLRQGKRIVTGGEIQQFSPILTPDHRGKDG
jgi:hypothetical protein